MESYFKTTSSVKALEWLKNNQGKDLYDEYGNSVVYVNGHIEHHYKLDEWDFDFDRVDEEEFIERFDDVELSEI